VKVSTLVIPILFICLHCSGQGRTNLFQGGYENYLMNIPWGGNKVDFLSGQPIVGQEFRAIDYDFTGTNITDSSGILLFATNGVIIMNNVNDTMVNGTGLNPSQYTSSFNLGLRLVQPNIILPDLSNPNRYYLFHMTFDIMGVNAQATNFYVSLIDMSLNNGNGQVIIKNQVLLNGDFSGNRLTACKHANGRDWWIAVVEAYGTEFYFFLLTPAGPVFSHSQSIGSRNGFGQATFSPDGSRYGSYVVDDDFEIFDFDRCTGELSNYRHMAINDSMGGFGAAFSPNSQYLYGSSSYYLYQIDASSNQPDTTLITVASWDGFYCPNFPFATRFFIQQLANDGKIYSSTGNGTCAMHSIEYPDSAGIACNVQQHSIILPTYNVGTMPNHPNYNLGPLIGSGCDTLTAINEMYVTKSLTLNVYPNPLVSDGFEINYSLEQNRVGVLEIFNATGQRVYSKTLPQWSSYQKLYIPELSNGIYLMRLKSGNKSAMIKFVKQEDN
jgi:hypothetical protein